MNIEGDPENYVEIVGVVAEVRYVRLEEAIEPDIVVATY